MRAFGFTIATGFAVAALATLAVVATADPVRPSTTTPVGTKIPQCKDVTQAPFPCAAGEKQVCTKSVTCYGDKPGLVPIKSSRCIQAKCVPAPATPAGNESPKALNPQPEPPGRHN